MLDRSECEALGQLWYAADLVPEDARRTLQHLRKRVDAYLTALNKDKT